MDGSFPLTLPSPPGLGERVEVRGFMHVKTTMRPLRSGHCVRNVMVPIVFFIWNASKDILHAL